MKSGGPSSGEPSRDYKEVAQEILDAWRVAMVQIDAAAAKIEGKLEPDGADIELRAGVELLRMILRDVDCTISDFQRVAISGDGDDEDDGESEPQSRPEIKRIEARLYRYLDETLELRARAAADRFRREED